jgi:hypothetical protein
MPCSRSSDSDTEQTLALSVVDPEDETEMK